MGTIKISVLEVDGVEYEYNMEMDLIDALTHVGVNTGFDNITLDGGNPSSTYDLETIDGGVP